MKEEEEEEEEGEEEKVMVEGAGWARKGGIVMRAFFTDFSTPATATPPLGNTRPRDACEAPPRHHETAAATPATAAAAAAAAAAAPFS